jgi:hypothetical protein
MMTAAGADGQETTMTAGGADGHRHLGQGLRQPGYPAAVREAATWRLQSEVRPSGITELPVQPQTQVTSWSRWRYSAIT